MHQRFVQFLTPAPDSVVARGMQRGKSPWVDAVHLLWSAWVFVVPVWNAEGWDARWFVTTLVTYPLFLALYFRCMVAPRAQVRAYALALVLLSMSLLSWYPSGLTYFIYGCVMLSGNSIRFRTYLGLLACLNLVLLAETSLLGYPWQAVFSIPLTSFIIGIIINAERASEEKDAQLRLSHEEVRRLAATAERERIGRDLHDLLGHTLSVVVVKAEAARRLARRDVDAALGQVADIEAVGRQALTEIREAVTGYREGSLATELDRARSVLAASDVEAVLQESGPPLPPQTEALLGWVVREGVTNVVRHSGASLARIELHAADGQARLTITDDGRGPTPPPAAPGTTATLPRTGTGLRGLTERLAAAGGSLTTGPSPSGGFRVTAVLPLGEDTPS